MWHRSESEWEAVAVCSTRLDEQRALAQCGGGGWVNPTAYGGGGQKEKDER